jgi:hypothetical protein
MIWYILLINHELVKAYQKIPISKSFNTYFLELQGVSSVLFDKFFSRHYWGITDFDSFQKSQYPSYIDKIQ